MGRRAVWSAIAFATAIASILALTPAAQAHNTPVGRIAYVVTQNNHSAIFWVDPTKPYTGSPLIDLGDRDASQPAWSFDGTQIAFTGETAPGGQTAIFVANGDGSGIQQATSPGTGESDSDASWSPAGDEIVFAREFPSGVSRLRIVNLVTGAVRSLDFPSLPSTAEPDWSPEGSRIAFVAQQVADPSVCSSDPGSCTWRLFVASADGTGDPRAIQPSGIFDYHNPDWSPDGTSVAVEFSSRTDPTFHIVEVISTSGTSDLRVLNGPVFEPSWSPYGFEQMVGTLGSGDSALVVLYVGDQPSTLLATGSQPAWGALPGVPPIVPPPFETTPPTIDFTFVTNDQGWLQGPRGQVVSEDPSGVSLYCTLDGYFFQSFYSPPGSATARGDLLFYSASEGEHVVRCTATDRWGNETSKSIVVKVDLTPPTLGAISFAPKVRRIDQTTDVSIPFAELGSGLNSASVQVGTGAQAFSFPLSASDATLTGTIGPSVPAGIWPLSVNAVDNNGNGSSRTYFFDYLVVYDPSAGSAEGTGWIVPGGPTSEIHDSLPAGLDGKTKASFSFKAQYKSETSTAPTGFFNMSYGSQFKFQSESFDWLVVTTQTAVLQGTASIKDVTGTFLFRATITDGASTGAPDRVELRVWQMDSNPFKDMPEFQATGDAGGQIQVQP